MSLLTITKNQCILAFQNAFAGISADIIEVTPATNKKFGHYQCNSAMKLSRELKQPPRQIAEVAAKELEKVDFFAKIEVAGPGFINITVENKYLAAKVEKLVEQQEIDIQLAVEQRKKVVIDFSSPNIAKEMHVGHLRSTIIGDCISRVLEAQGHEVLRLNHVGDWGTQFGMLISYLKKQKLIANSKLSNMTLTDLVNSYKQAKKLFDEDPEFKKQAQQQVVKLQALETESVEIWKTICDISKVAFEEVYAILNIKNLEVRGESFYNPMLSNVIAELESKKLVTVSDGAKCIFLDGFKNRDGDPLPLIVQKSDGGFNYATTDIAALKHRVEEENADWIIYVTDAGQAQHFNMVFAACEQAGYAHNIKLSHVPFGLVLRSDGKKFKTREGETERLIDLLTTAVQKARDIMQQRGLDNNLKELEQKSEKLGINAIKYADLCNNRINDYVFSYDNMLQFEGNTAAFINYALVRSTSIQSKKATNTSSSITITEDAEINLCLHLLQYQDAINAFTNELLPNRITDYLFNLAELFHSFHHSCRVLGTEQEASRLKICKAVEITLSHGMDLLGLRPLDKM